MLAQKEQRSLGNLGEVLLEWATKQLRTAGNTNRLFDFNFGPRHTGKR